MIKRKILSKEEMKKPILEGFTKMADIVAQTLGPGGLPILIQRQGQMPNGDPLGPMITKDGVTVANECYDSNAEVDVVLQAIKDICRKTNRMVGDGTTTAIVLGHAILKEALLLIEAKHANPQVVRNQLEETLKEVSKKLEEMSIPCTSMDMVEHVASISANGDKAIGKLIRQAFESVGVEGVVTVDEGTGKDHTLDIVAGYQFQRGAEAQERFFNDSTNTKFEAENAYILLYDGRLEDPKGVADLLDKLQKKLGQTMPPIVLVANDFTPDIIQTLLIWKAELGLRVCAVKGPHTTTVRTQFYEDMAVFLGGYRFGNGNRNLASAEFDDLGLTDKVVITKYTATLYGGQGTEEAVLARIEQLKVQKTQAESSYDASIIADRISYLGEGIAKIGVGGLTDLEIKEAYHRIEDAVNAAKVAIEGGIVAGGGSALLRISKGLNEDTFGNMILKKALRAPFQQILKNLGVDETSIAAYAEGFIDERGLVYDGTKGLIVPGIESGVIDPVKVTKTALSAAISIAGLMCTAGGAIIFHE